MTTTDDLMINRQQNVKTTIEHKDGKMIFKCVPNDEICVRISGKNNIMTRSKAVDFFWDIIRMGDNFEVEQGAYALFDILAGNTRIENDL